jgi:hypothetical protein
VSFPQALARATRQSTDQLMDISSLLSDDEEMMIQTAAIESMAAVRDSPMESKERRTLASSTSASDQKEPPEPSQAASNTRNTRKRKAQTNVEQQSTPRNRNREREKCSFCSSEFDSHEELLEHLSVCCLVCE